MELFIDCNASDSSKRLYTHNLKRLNDGKPISSLNFLKKTDEIMTKINKMNRNTARSYIIACVVACKRRKGFKKCLDVYDKAMHAINNELKNATAKSPRFIENELSWDEILKARDALPKDSVEYVVMCLFTMIPPRRNLDYLMTTKPTEKGNFYNGKEFVFQNYKTAGTYKTQVLEVPSNLKKVIDNYLNVRPFKSDDLLIKRSGLPFKTKDIQSVINRATGKQIGCTLLRSIFLTSKYGDVMNELKHDTESMATSVDVARSTYIKSD